MMSHFSYKTIEFMQKKPLY